MHGNVTQINVTTIFGKIWCRWWRSEAVARTKIRIRNRARADGERPGTVLTPLVKLG